MDRAPGPAPARPDRPRPLDRPCATVDAAKLHTQTTRGHAAAADLARQARMLQDQATTEHAHAVHAPAVR